MTENEAIKCLEKQIEIQPCMNVILAFETAIQALEEIQQYRALEEKLNGISVAQVVGGFINTIEKGTAEEYMRGRILTNRETDMWDEYLSIGTVEEFKALKEKSVAKKPQEISWGATNCPICGQEFGFNSHFNHCSKCGQKLDWQ